MNVNSGIVFIHELILLCCDLPRLESLNCMPESNAMGLHAFNRSELPFKLLAFMPFSWCGGEADMRRRADELCEE